MKEYICKTLKYVAILLPIVLVTLLLIKFTLYMKEDNELKFSFTSFTNFISKDKDQEIEKYVFVGDSRYVGMEKFESDKDLFISKEGIGYDYLVEKLDRIKSVCHKNTALIIGLGVNDVNYNCKKYIEEINKLAKDADYKIFYMSINPVDDERASANGYYITNEAIDTFNDTIKDELNDKIFYIDSNSYLNSHGFTTVDGLHYDDDTYEKIYEYIKKEVDKSK